jgi:hypothetical protein
MTGQVEALLQRVSILEKEDRVSSPGNRFEPIEQKLYRQKEKRSGGGKRLVSSFQKAATISKPNAAPCPPQYENPHQGTAGESTMASEANQLT